MIAKVNECHINQRHVTSTPFHPRTLASHAVTASNRRTMASRRRLREKEPARPTGLPL